MSHGKRLASFCRLCLIKTQTKVAIFNQQEEANLLNLLKLIELEINPEVEPEAVLCYDCIVTLEGFLQFKEQCHANDEFLKTLPPKDSAEGSESSEEEPEEESVGVDCMHVSHGIVDSEEEGRVDDVDMYEEPKQKREALKKSLKKQSSSVKRLKSTHHEHPQVSEDLLDVRQSGRIRKPTAKALASSVNKSASKRTSPIRADLVEEKLKRKKIDPPKFREPTANELQPLKDSYPDYFHFEKSPRSLYFTLVYYGERFNSAIYGGNQTYWQCAYKRKFRCPAVVHVSNDYTHFERRFEHTHGDQQEKLGELELFTPRQALPTVFRICWQKLLEKKARQQELKKERQFGKEADEEVEQAEDNASADDEDDLEDDGTYSLIKMLNSDEED